MEMIYIGNEHIAGNEACEAYVYLISILYILYYLSITVVVAATVGFPSKGNLVIFFQSYVVDWILDTKKLILVKATLTEWYGLEYYTYYL